MISSISAISACFIMFPHVSSYFIIFHPFIFMDFPLRSSTNTTCGWSPNLKSFLRSSVWCFSAQLLEDLGDDLLGFSIRFCQTCSPPTSEKFLCIVFSHLGDFWNLCSRSFGLSKLRKTMSTQGDSPNFTTLRYVAIAILTLASMIFGYLQANYQGGMIFCFFPKNAAKKKRKRFRKITTTLVSTYVLGVSFPTIHLRLRLPCLDSSSMGGSRPSVLGQAQNGPKMWIHFAHGAPGMSWPLGHVETAQSLDDNVRNPYISQGFWRFASCRFVETITLLYLRRGYVNDSHLFGMELAFCVVFFAWLGVLFHFYLIMTESVSVFHVSLRWIYPPPSNSGKWRFITGSLLKCNNSGDLNQPNRVLDTQ